MADTLNLSELGKHFSNEDSARELLEWLRWKGNPVCPHCEATGAYKIEAKEDSKSGARKGLWKCKACRQQFSVTVGTIFEDSKIPLSKWLLAIHLVCSSKKGMSALQLQRNLGLGSYRTAWFMAHRIRYAMTQEPLFSKLNGIVESDETFIGGKEGNKHANKRLNMGRGAIGKAAVVTLVERGGRVKSHHVPTVTGATLKKAMLECIATDARIMTDESPSYKWAKHHFADHQAVNHRYGEYVRGTAHVNTCESIHALLKRGVIGTFHHVSKKHLHRYLVEFDFRFNHRKIEDGERTLEAIKGFEGKRLMYKTPVKKS